MKKILIAAFLLISFISQAQRMLVLPDTPTFANQNRGVWVFRIADNLPYYSNGTRWVANTGGLGAQTISDSLTAYNSRVVTSYNGVRGPVKGVDSLWFTNSGTIMHWRFNGLIYSQNVAGIGGSSAWGTITGTLSDQTDLQAALNLKLSLADTADMLDPYLRKIDTTAKWVTSARRRADSVFVIVGGGEVFVFKDSTGGSGSQNLQQVTDIGNFTTGSIRSGNSFKMYDATNTNIIGEWINNSNARSELYIYNTSTGRQSLLTNNLLEFKGTGFNYQAIKPFATPSAAYVNFTLPDASTDKTIPVSVTINGVTYTANTITGDVDLGTISGGNLINGGNNLGSGAQWFKDTSGNKLNFRTATAGWGLDVTQNADDNEYKVDSNEVATKYSVDTAKINIRNEITQEGVTWGTVVQRLSLDTSTLREGYAFYQTDQLRGKYEFSSYLGWRFIGAPFKYVVNDQFQFDPGGLGAQHATSVSGTNAVARVLPFSDIKYDSLYDRGTGIWEIATGTTSTGFAAIWSANSSFGILRNANFYSEAWLYIDSLSTPTDSYRLQVGLKARGAAPSGQNEVLFYYSDTTAGGVWMTLTTRGDGFATHKNTGVTATRGWVKLGIEWYSDVPSATYRSRFYINDVLVTTHENVGGTGDYLTTTTEGGSHVTSANIRKIAGTTNRRIFFDYFNCYDQSK